VRLANLLASKVGAEHDGIVEGPGGKLDFAVLQRRIATTGACSATARQRRCSARPVGRHPASIEGKDHRGHDRRVETAEGSSIKKQRGRAISARPKKF